MDDFLEIFQNGKGVSFSVQKSHGCYYDVLDETFDHSVLGESLG